MIVFKRLSFQNILSVGNTPVTLDLNTHKTLLVHGSNGSGKSTVLDAICYALFNKPFRPINLPQLVNSSNKKDLFVEIEFTIGNTDYVVGRGMKPKKFIILRNGEQLDSKAADKDNQLYLEQQILKMNLKTFIQVVILGSGNFVPFMQLGGMARRDCVEDFLDIKVFSTMAIIAKERLRSLKDKMKEYKNDLSTIEYKIELQEERIQEIQDRSKQDTQSVQTTIDNMKAVINGLEVESDELQRKDKLMMVEVTEMLKYAPENQYNTFKEVLIKMEHKLENLHKDIDFYNDHDQCPTCSQDLTESLKVSMVGEKQTETDKLTDAISQAEHKLNDYADRLTVIRAKETEISSIHQEIYRLQTQINTYNQQIISYENKLVELLTSNSNTDKEEAKLNMLIEDKTEVQLRINELIHSISNHEIVVNLLKDSGIKTQIVRKYLPVMNKAIRKYLTDLDFPILFSLDEQFNERVLSPMHQDFSYASFSEGQKARIDLALMFCWREIGKLKNSVSTNLLVLDEVFSSSLDEVGKENLLALLRYGLDDTQRVVVVDHTLSGAFREKFNHSIEVSRVRGFSQYD